MNSTRSRSRPARRVHDVCLTIALLAAAPPCAAGQSGGFVVTLGSDTIQLERFERSSSRIQGSVLTRVPQARVARYTLELDNAGLPLRYEVAVRRPDGTPLMGDGQAGEMTFTRDTVVRRTLAGGVMTEQRVAAASPVFPNLAGSWLLYELGIQMLRRTGAAYPTPASQPLSLATFTMTPAQQRPGAMRVWLIRADSAEVDFFGVARSGWRFDASGRLVRSDWSATTLKYSIQRVATVDIESVARRWADEDARGVGMRALSPRDTMHARIDDATVAVDYSRPSRRGRDIWGALVPWDQVWRLGADVATHMETSADFMIGGTRVPAGRYTLWMLPSARGPSRLIINSRVNLFGTQYDGTGDFARVPLESAPPPPAGSAEQLTIVVRDGFLWISWHDRSWRATLARAR
jgi:hypothetical protein